MKEKMVTTREVHYKLWVQGRAYYVVGDDMFSMPTDIKNMGFLVTPCETTPENGLVHGVPHHLVCFGNFALEECNKEISVFEMLDVEQDEDKEPNVPEPALPADYAVVDPGNGEEYPWTSLQ